MFAVCSMSQKFRQAWCESAITPMFTRLPVLVFLIVFVANPGLTIGQDAKIAQQFVANPDLDVPFAKSNPHISSSPATYLGRPVGTDFQLADWKQVAGYYQKLDQASDALLLQNAGKTTEGRDLLVAVISSPANLARLPEIQREARLIADPRLGTANDRLLALAQGTPIVLISLSMHSDEPASTEMGMQLAWLLATSDEAPWREIRENVVVVLIPSLNPDGVDHIVSFYRERVGTPYEGAALNKLYQFYTGHDNNRDFFSLTQNEARLMTHLLYHEWKPQVMWDAHQYGAGTRERFFVPPYRDPLNPNLDRDVVAAINLMGTRAVADMTRAGHSGIATGIGYDNWWNGGNRSVPARHNMVGILTEAASVNIASPVFIKPSELKDPLQRPEYLPSNQFIHPWPGGWWRLQDIVNYELAFAKSMLSSVSREPRFWLETTHAAASRAISDGHGNGVRGWIIPAQQVDRHAIRRFADILLLSGIELHVATKPLLIDGRSYPAGSIVIRRDQPYGRHAKDLLELKGFPAGEKPYDVSGWALAHLFGLRRVEVLGDLPDDLQPVATADEAIRGMTIDARIAAGDRQTLSTRDSGSWKALTASLGRGDAWEVATQGKLTGLMRPANSPFGMDEATEKVTISRLPRIGLYAPWTASMDEGWLRWVLDDAGIPFVTVRNEMLKAGELQEFLDVLILPDVTSKTINEGRAPGTIEERYAGGLGPEGILAIDQFVKQGGKLITTEGSAAWAISQFSLPIENVVTSKDAEGFSCPGSVLRVTPADDPLTAGLPDSIPMMFSGSAAWQLNEGKSGKANKSQLKTLASYPENNLLLAGFIARPEVLAQKGAWVEAKVDAGKIHLFAFRPHYRAWSQGTFPLLFRAILLP
ncbi:peptidase M14, carboxypeptidase A [Planctopirus limnophila DSM 3776]|uniref:Peptidase M14, carboxypeptidase A n=1 Tax=Planctopirus limnophila (strain ATCC 43296 / DSM 3776 / IFAM 1008 / Mu 290) TaxID=521674 RepID=D5SP05_PLAL2|nr:M14 family zinc carboxypeptidase [Planctopirus limnophila]ADG66160.1 peptidase M14, carboxypeptidase A [Planctopirus limnophila DSM 3776]